MLPDGPICEYPVWARDMRSWISRERAGPLRLILALSRQIAVVARRRPLLVSTPGLLDRKYKALARHMSQIGGIETDPDWPKLDAAFIWHFFRPHEVFCEVRQRIAPAPNGGSDIAGWG